MTRTISPLQLRERLDGGGELALLDVREEGVFARNHLFWATCLPLSRLELRIRDLAPRFGAPIVVCDGGEGLAETAAGRLGAWGYNEVYVLAGGLSGWEAEGFSLYSGFNVPSKAFGEFVEHQYETPSVSPEELHEMLESGRDMVILDSRPMDEYSRMNIPAGVNVPGGELVYRVHNMAPDPSTLVVVNCAGRTRSIIGAQSLINAGIPNQVTALRNGTMGWHLAGLELERGKARTAPDPSAQSIAQAQEAAQGVAKRFGVRFIDYPTLQGWMDEGGDRTLYVLDVRIPEEYESGHMPGVRNAPGGQLAQATDTFMATRGARVVLVDSHQVRATMAASWLIQMGWREVFVLEDGQLPFGLEQGPHQPEIPGLDGIEVEELSPGELAQELDDPDLNDSEGPVVVDLALSPTYRKGHIPGAWFAIRTDLPQALPKLPQGRPLVLASPDGIHARLTAPEAAAIWQGPVLVLTGGTNAWRAMGLPLEEGDDRLASEPVDVHPKPYDHASGQEQAMRDYLTWEVDLVHRVEKDGEARFEPFPKE